MSLTLFYRNRSAGFSIHKVFGTLQAELAKTNQLISIEVPARRADLLSVIKNIIFVFKHRNKNGINHVTGDIHYAVLGLIGCKSVLTVHDLSMIDCAKNPLKRLLITLLWLRLPLWLANEVVCISEHTRRELCKVTKRKDIKVIYNAVDPTFTYLPKVFNETVPVVLQVGTGWNKNLNRVIASLENIKCHLVVIGELEEESKELLKKTNQSYSAKSGLSDQELLAEYEKCDLITFCSIYEGFGMPIIEANAIGRCVVTSNLSPMPEVGGDAVSTVDPEDQSSITSAVQQILADATYRERLILNGLKNVARFNVKEIATAYEKIYATLNKPNKL